LIEAHIAEHHTDPVTGEDLSIEDLIELKSPRIVKPRPPTLTSIPSLLAAFQTEWDSVVLETFTLKKQLAQTRQELSTALYQNDAATRVIARITRERDEAREALSNITISGGGAAAAGDVMQVDSQELPQHLAAKVDETQQQWVLFVPMHMQKLTMLDFRAHVENDPSRMAGRQQKLSSHSTRLFLLTISILVAAL